LATTPAEEGLQTVTRARTYSYADIAGRIEEVLGERPLISVLRAAAARSSHGTNSRVRITAGMPAPMGRDGREPIFRATEIERWLAHHPRLAVQAEMTRLAQTFAGTNRRERAVARARVSGLSWQQIADALGTADDRVYTRQSVHQSFGR
jgi:DNA-binding NarL/FixJ family response regulator